MDAHAAQALLNFAASAGEGLRGIDSKAMFQKLDECYGELQSALGWFIEYECATDALRLASALVPFWMATKRLDEGSAWLDRALALPGGESPSRARRVRRWLSGVLERQ